MYPLFGPLFWLFCGAPVAELSPEIARKDVLGALSQIIDPDFGTDIVSCGFVKELSIDEGTGQVSPT